MMFVLRMILKWNVDDVGNALRGDAKATKGGVSIVG